MSRLIRFNGDGASFDDMTPSEKAEQTSALHAGSPIGADYTLCGDTPDGDSHTMGSFEVVEAKYVTCKACVTVVRAARQYRIRGD